MAPTLSELEDRLNDLELQMRCIVDIVNEYADKKEGEKFMRELALMKEELEREQQRERDKAQYIPLGGNKMVQGMQ